jgi:tetratricopeptide (TPR) repeat protein
MNLELDPLSLINNADLGTAYYFARRYDEAIDQLRKTLEMDPSFYPAHASLGRAFEGTFLVQRPAIGSSDWLGRFLHFGDPLDHARRVLRQKLLGRNRLMRL